MIVTAVLQAWRLRRKDTPVFVTAIVTGTLFGGQVLVGAQNVLAAFPTFINGLHIATATAVWASMVVFAVLEVFLRTLTNRFGTPSRDYSRRVGGTPPR